MTRTALALRHLHFEDAGLLEGVLAQAGYTLSYLDVWREAVPERVEADLLIALGGPIGVYDAPEFPFLAREIALLKDRMARDLPTLGVCLGSQLMAAALGAPVYPGKAGKELGWAPLSLTPEGAAGPLAALEGVEVLHWHGDTFDLPQGCTRLASTAAYANQAFSRADRVLALQFHAEVDAQVLEAWLIGHSGELAGQGISPSGLRGHAREAETRLVPAARRMFGAWLAGL